MESMAGEFAAKWHVNEDTTMYAADHCRSGDLPHISKIKEDADYGSYKERRIL